VTSVVPAIRPVEIADLERHRRSGETELRDFKVTDA
jgi:hypothetical protein